MSMYGRTGAGGMMPTAASDPRSRIAQTMMNISSPPPQVGMPTGNPMAMRAMYARGMLSPPPPVDTGTAAMPPAPPAGPPQFATPPVQGQAPPPQFVAPPAQGQPPPPMFAKPPTF
jgi:hypothetical protein